MDNWLFEGTTLLGYALKCPICGKIHYVDNLNDAPKKCKVCGEAMQFAKEVEIKNDNNGN